VSRVPRVRYPPDGWAILSEIADGGFRRAGALNLGAVTVADVRANVVETMPQFGDRPLSGILGVDVLRCASRLRLERKSDGAGTITFGPTTQGGPNAGDTTDVEIPFAWVVKHILIDSTFGNVTVSLILDTGARDSFSRHASLKPALFAHALRR